MREFAKAADLARKRAEKTDQPPIIDDIPIKVAGREIEVHFPDPGQVMYMTMLLASEGDTWQRAGELLNFLMNLVDDDDRRFLRGMLLDRDSGFDHTDVEEILEYLTEQWSGNPTARPADFKRSQRAGGPSSTGTASRRASTRSRSTRAASATSSGTGA